MRHPSTASLLVSVVAIGTATETTTVLRATFCFLGNNRVVVCRGALVNRASIHRDHADSAMCGAVGERSIAIPSAATTVATFAHLQYDTAHCTELFPFRGKGAVGVGDVDVINVCACTSSIGSSTPGGATTPLACATTSTATTTVNVGCGPADIATLPTSRLEIGICVLCIRMHARDVCGHELTGSVKVVLHAVEYSCFGSFDTCAS